jgi:hypothetical protein
MANNIAQLASDIEHAAEKFNTTDTFESAQEKQRLLLATRSLLDKLEGPEVGIWRVMFGVSEDTCENASRSNTDINI